MICAAMSIWAGVLGIFHSFVGLFVHFRDRANSFLYYFIFPPETKAAIPFRFDLFGLANYTRSFRRFIAWVAAQRISNDFALKTRRESLEKSAAIELSVFCACSGSFHILRGDEKASVSAIGLLAFAFWLDGCFPIFWYIKTSKFAR
ncbi:MAG: hypothetical protein WKF73_16410 [Nocardioidaceae bacterium]